MTITGHKTRSVFDRNHIVSQTDLTDAARKLELNQQQQTAALHQSKAQEFGQSWAEPAPNRGANTFSK